MKQLLILVCLLMTTTAVTLQAKTLVDPTRPSEQIVAQQKDNMSAKNTEFVLNAVFINAQNKYAVINGKQYQEGQVVLGNKLLLVSQNHVVLDSSSGQKTLFINHHNIKKDINNDF